MLFRHRIVKDSMRFIAVFAAMTLLAGVVAIMKVFKIRRLRTLMGDF